MTAKQKEALIFDLQFAYERAVRTGDSKYLSDMIKKIHDLLNMMFDMHVIPDYKTVDKIRTEVYTTATNYYKEHAAEWAA